METASSESASRRYVRLKCRWLDTYFPFFHMAVYSQRFQEKISSDTGWTLEIPASSFTSLTATDSKSVSPSACPPSQDRIVYVVIYHKDFRPFSVYYPGRSCHMGYCIFPGKSILIISDPVQDQDFIFFFLLIVWLVFSIWSISFWRVIIMHSVSFLNIHKCIFSQADKSIRFATCS